MSDMTAPPADPQGTMWTDAQREVARDIADTLDPWRPWSWSNMEPMLPMLAKHAHLFATPIAETPAERAVRAFLEIKDEVLQDVLDEDKELAARLRDLAAQLKRRAPAETPALDDANVNLLADFINSAVLALNSKKQPHFTSAEIALARQALYRLRALKGQQP